jgi:CheY-like chemotaxis protein
MARGKAPNRPGAECAAANCCLVLVFLATLGTTTANASPPISTLPREPLTESCVCVPGKWGKLRAVILKHCNLNTILVVEDEPPIRLMIAEALREEGFQVVEAGSGDEALSVVESGTPVNLVFADVRMPGTLDGIALMSRLRETRPDLKLAVASRYSPDWPSPNLVDVFIGKPYDVPRTIFRLKTLLDCAAGPVD